MTRTGSSFKALGSSVTALWAPAACTLPTAERPLRAQEFDEFFAEAVTAVERVDEVSLRLMLRPDPLVAARAAQLCAQETVCCSFFSFTLVISEGAVTLNISVPPAQVQMLDALAERAAALSASGAA